MNKKPVFDLFVLLAIFLIIWNLKSFLPQVFQGPTVVLVISLTGFLIMKIRGLSFEEIGFVKRTKDRVFGREIILISMLIFGVQFLGILVIGFLFGTPEAGTAVTSQPQSIIGFLLDIIIVVWFVTGLGEEFIFRGIIMNRLQAVFQNSKLSSTYTCYQAFKRFGLVLDTQVREFRVC